MDAIPASAESYADRHQRLCQDLRAGDIADPERWLFLELLDDLPPCFHATPLLFDVSWGGGRFDLLFTDGRGCWCAVEVKRAVEIYGTSNARKNRRTKRNKKWNKLVTQSHLAFAAARARHEGDSVRGLALWRSDVWWVVAEHGQAEPLRLCA
ncbi:MAG TPA: hypothetical protein PKA64_00945 [Myxococcota bacterium]|nr:hypothetical protein [Myxococcota bacterium]